MELVNKSRALNILIPQLISKSNNLTKEIKNRIKLNKIFSEFENKASNNFNYFISSSNQRYTNSKLGNNLDSIINSTRAKNIDEATKIVNDKFYKDKNLEIEKQKMKYKSTEKIYNDIKNTFNKMRIPLESKFGRNSQKEIDSILQGKDNNSSHNKRSSNIWNMFSEKEVKPFVNAKDNVRQGKKAINLEFQKDKNTLDNYISKYLNDIQNENTLNSFNSLGNSPKSSKKFISYKLPKIKLINYRQKSPPKKNVITEEQKKPNIRKLLPYSRLGKLCHIEPEKEDNSFTELPNKNYPFITEAKITNDNNKCEDNYQNTLDVVYNSANKEFVLRNNFDKKRKRLEMILGMDTIPQLNTYDDILFKKFERIKNKRHERARKINKSQRASLLSKKERINMIIDNDMELLDHFENKLYNKTNEK